MASTLVTDGEYIQKDDPLNDDRDQQQELFDLYDEMGDSDRAETWISVTRIPMDSSGNAQPNSKHAGHLFQAALGTMSASDIIIEARKFIRAGQTSIMIRVRGSKKGARGSLFNKIFVVERTNDSDEKIPADKTENLFRLIQENSRVADERNREFMNQMLAMQARSITPVAPAADPIDQMTRMMTAMGGMMAAMMNGGAVRPASASGSATDELLKTITVMQKIGVIGGEPLEKDESLGDIVKAVAGPALQFFAAQKQGENLKLANATQVRRRLAPPQPAPTIAPTQSAAQPVAPAQPVERDPKTINLPAETSSAPIANKAALTAKGDPVELEKLNAALKTVVDLADKGRSPEDVAKLVLNTIPQEQESDFYDQIANDDFVTHCELLNEGVTRHKEWFLKLRAAMLAEFQPDDSASTPA